MIPSLRRTTHAAAAACVVALGCAGGSGAEHVAPAGHIVRVAVISDMNGPYGSTTYGAEVHEGIRLIREQWKPDLVLAAGDMIAGQRPTLSDDEVRAMWASFDDAVARPLRDAGIPFGFTIGNHDGSAYPAHQRDRAFAVEHWRSAARTPRLAFADSTRFPLYYSFTHGPLFIVAWDAASATTHSDTTMMSWLRRELQSDAARAASFRIVLGHLPLHAVAEGRDRPGEVLAEADMLRELLQQYDVHTYISGHHHAYYPGRRGPLEMLHAGALGDGPRPLLGTTEPSPRTVTIMEFDAARRTVEYTTYRVDAGAPPQRVEVSTLPARVDGHNGFVIRRDVRSRD